MFLYPLTRSLSRLLHSIAIKFSLRAALFCFAFMLTVSLGFAAMVSATRSTVDSESVAGRLLTFVSPHSRTYKSTQFIPAVTPVTTVSAASYETTAIAPESIVAGFGVSLATQTVGATTQPLPTNLGGTTVEVNGQAAQLFFVSPGQVNYLIPAGTTPGTANVVIRDGNGTVSNGTVQVSQSGPALFTANSDGVGVPAAFLVRVKTNGQQIFESLSEFNASLGRVVTKPIDMGPDGERVFLVLFPSGIRRAADPNSDGNVRENVHVLIGGIEIVPDYAGAQPGFAGLDQINAELPRSLIGRGKINLAITVAGYGSSNICEIEIAGPASTSPPAVTSFGSANVLAGQTLTINGSGFSLNPSDNTVRIAGTEADLISSSAAQLSVTVPFGVETGTVSVSTPQGQGSSGSMLPVRTSISGFIEDTQQQPMSGVAVKLLGTTPITTTTNAEGLFILPDVPAGAALVEMDASTLTSPPYPKITLKRTITANRDNQFAQPVAMQQSTGPSIPVGTGGGTAEGIAEGAESTSETQASIVTGGVTFDVPSGTAVFPDGSTGGLLFLTLVENSRTPTALPKGFFSSVIAQIYPFDVMLNPGGKLSFPNPEGLAPGVKARLFFFDQTPDSPTRGDFIDIGEAAVSGDGQHIDTADGAITRTGIYFVATLQPTTTVIGRVVESGSGTPVRRALVSARGREDFTDGNGGFILRNVPVKPGGQVSVEVSYLRPTGRIERKQSNSVPVVPGGITLITPAIELPARTLNRAPVILAPFKLSISEASITDVKFVASDPDRNQTITVSSSGTSFVTSINNTGDLYTMRLIPGFNDAGTYTLNLTATDNFGLSTTRQIAVTVTDTNRAPSLTSPGNRTTNENVAVSFTLSGSDPDTGQTLTYSMTNAPAGATLNPATGAFSYTPGFGVASQAQPSVPLSITFTVTDNGSPARSASQTITITVNNVNRGPTATPQGVTLNEDTPTNITLTATDLDSDTLTWTVVNTPQHGTLSGTAPNLLYTPAANYNGSDNFSFRVNDGLLNSNEAIVSITINAINDPPVLTVPGTQTINEGQALRITVSATDVESPPQTVALSVSGSPTGATFDTSTGIFSWTPGFTQAGNYVLTFKATDNGSPQASDTKTVTVVVHDFLHDLAVDPENFTIFGDKADNGKTDPGDTVGTSVATGDLNGDGITDLAVGAPTANGSVIDQGRVYVFFGKLSNGLIDLQKQSPDLILTGENAGDLFGSSLAIGDLNGDGIKDLIIGAPDADDLPSQRNNCGKVYAVFGKLTTGSFTIGQAAGLIIIGQNSNDAFGTTVAAGEVTQKGGPADLIASAPLFDVSGAANLTDAGRVYLFAGGTNLKGTLDLVSKPERFTVSGHINSGQIGRALAVGDVNGDGFAELAIGEPQFNAQTLRGAVYLVYGAADLSGDRTFGSQASDLSLLGRDSGDRLGGALAIGDINGDGRGDLIIGAPASSGLNNASLFAGEVYVFFGAAGLTGLRDLSQSAADLTVYGAPNGNDVNPGLGAGIAVGDFTGDGITDLALGSPGVTSGVPRSDCGAVYLLFGSKSLGGTIDLAKTSAPLTVFGADSGDLIGWGGLAIGDLSGAAPGDLVIGMPRAASVSNQRAGAGEVRILFGTAR